MLNIFNCVFVIIGTIVGAGFASGKEIFSFFNVYGFYGFIGIFISCFIIGFIIFRALNIILKNNINSYYEFVSTILNKNKITNSIFCNIINIFLLISYCVMVSGFAAYFKQEFNLNFIFGALIISILSFCTFLYDIKGITKVNTYIIPIIIFLIFLLGIKNFDNIFYTEFITYDFNLSSIFKSILYASYNLILVFPMLINLKKFISDAKNIKIIAIIVACIMLLLSSIIFLLLNTYFENIKNLDLPIIYIANSFGTTYKYIYGLVILFAIFTTNISSGYSFLTNLNLKNRKKFIIANFLLCLLAICMSNIGFSTLLNLMYPVLGVFGLIQILILCFHKSIEKNVFY